MTAMTNYTENKLLDHLFRGTSFSAPSNLYVGLFTASPTDTGGGTECTGGSYARVTVACNGTNWAGTQGAGTTAVSSGDSGTVSNNTSITFPTPTAGWGTVIAVGLFDAATGGNMLLWGPVSPSKTINLGDAPPQFAPGDLQFQIDN
jgi:hypothetical protein